jgi:hypothetical protein
LENDDIHILWQFGIFYEHWGFFMTIWYIFCSFGPFFRLWCLVPRKIWQPWIRSCDTLSHKLQFPQTEKILLHMGCQIFLGTTYQNGKNTKLPQKIPKGYKIYQMSVKYTNKTYFFYIEKTRSSLQQRWRCSCKIKSRRIGS